MSKKYIRQQILQDFVYPNNEVSQYDIDNIVHDINDNSVDGTVTNFSATTISSSSITFSYTASWSLNDAERWIRNSNVVGLWSVHMLAPGQDYFKPWRLISSVSTSNLNVTGITSTITPTISASSMGLSSFTNGTYYFEFRFIGHRAIFPVCASLNLNIPTPTPTPSITPTNSLTPTPTITPTSGLTPTPTPTLTPTQTLTPTPSSTETGSGTLYVYAKYYNSSDELGYELNGGPYLGIGTVPTTSCDFLAVITGLTNGDSIVFETLLGKAISGSGSDCPVAAINCTYTHTFTGSGSNFVYITIDGMNNC